MKKFLLTLLAVFALTTTLLAQPPQGFNYQMVVRNSAGQLMANKTVSIRIRIMQGSETGSVVYDSTGSYLTNANGLVTMVVGENSTDYAAINWGNGPYFIVTDVDPDGGVSYTLHTAQQILSVPYANYARVADHVSSSFTYNEQDPKFASWGYDYDSLVNEPTRLSDFINDLNLSDFNNDLSLSDFNNDLVIDWDSIANRPTSLSQFVNDLNLSSFNNDITIYWDSVINRPTNLSQFTNDLNLSDINIDMTLNDFTNDLTIDWDSVINRPTNLSQFTNDITVYWDSVINRPTNLSQFTNDITVYWDSVINRPTKLSQFVNDLNLSDLNNDMSLSDFNNDITIEWDSINNRPANLSQFNNDLNLSDFTNDITIKWDSISGRPTNLSQFNNDMTLNYNGDTLFFGSNYVVIPNTEWDSINNRPTNLSQFNNDLPFYVSNDTLYFDNKYVVLSTALALAVHWNNVVGRPTNLSQFINDLTLEWDSIINHPTALSDFTNDLGFISSESQNLADVLGNGNSANNTIITDLPLPVNNNDAANKIYVDNALTLANNRSDSLSNVLNALRGSMADSLDNLRARMADSIADLRDQLDSLQAAFDSIDQTVYEEKYAQIDGELNGIFSVSPTKRVRFSKGNLQYRPRINTWRFALNQWNIAGSANNNANSGVYCNDWIDLFGYGTSGWDGGAANYQPYQTNTYDAGYSEATDGNDLVDMYANGDWGFFNPIINGNNQMGLWRTLTYSEWTYIINDRPNAGQLRGLATIESVPGYIILPDDWTLPSGSTFSSIENSYSVNVYNSTQWQVMEAAGAVFLPAAGLRSGTSTTSMGIEGEYWSTSHVNGTVCWSMKIMPSTTSGAGATATQTNASIGCSVRVVRDYKE